MNRELWLDAMNGMEDDIIEETARARAGGQGKRRIRLRPILAAAVLVVALLGAMPVLASEVPNIYELMYLVSPEMAQRFHPVQERCEDQGIAMEVVSTSIHDNVAEIYVTMQDLTGDRIDGTTDLFDSYDIHRPYDSAATCGLVGYEEETKTATFLITIEEWDNEKMVGSNITFSVREFLSHKTKLEDVPVEADLRQAEASPRTIQVEETGFSGSEETLQALLQQSRFAVLEPVSPICTPAEHLYLTGMGYIDGKLHLQLKMEEKPTLDPHGYFYLVDEAGERLGYSYSISFMREENGEQIDYQEFVFDLPQEELSRYQIYGYFCTSGMLTQGNWQVTFPLVNRDS